VGVEHRVQAALIYTMVRLIIYGHPLSSGKRRIEASCVLIGSSSTDEVEMYITMYRCLVITLTGLVRSVHVHNILYPT